MKKLVKGVFILNAFIVLVFCSSCRFNESIQEKKNANKPTPVVKKEVIESDSESLAKKIVKADSYFNNDMYADSYSLYMEAAVKGDAHSQFKVGWMLYKGKGVSKNKNLAYDWWKKAARQGHADSINYLTRLGKW